MAPSSTAPLAPLELALLKRIEQDYEHALRVSLSLLEATPEWLDAALLTAELLLDSDRPLFVAEASHRLVDGYVRRGDLPAAVFAAHLAKNAGEDTESLYSGIADAFSLGSKRVGAVTPMPPSTGPTQVETRSSLRPLSHVQLLEKAEEALVRFSASEDPVSAARLLPRWPLFGQLEKEPLKRLLEVLVPRYMPPQATIVRQGDDDKEAYVLVRGSAVVHRLIDDQRFSVGTLGDGAIFGEMALINNAPRAASVETRTPVRLLVAEREPLENTAKNWPAVMQELRAFCQSRMVTNVLHQSQILQAIDAECHDELLGYFEVCTYNPGRLLLRQDEEAEGILWIAAGRVDVVRTDEQGDRLLLTTLGPGDIVGEISLVLRRKTSADVIAVQPTVVLRLPRSRFHDTIRAYPRLLNGLYELAIKRAEETERALKREAVHVEDAVIV